MEAAFGEKLESIDEPSDLEDKSPNANIPDETTDDPEFIEGFTENGDFLEENIKKPEEPKKNPKDKESKPKKKPVPKKPVIPEPDLGEEEFIEFDPDGD